MVYFVLFVRRGADFFSVGGLDRYFPGIGEDHFSKRPDLENDENGSEKAAYQGVIRCLLDISGGLS